MGLEEAMRLEIEELIEEKTALRAQLMGKTTAEAIKMAFDNGDSYLESVMVRAKQAEADRDTLRAQLAAANSMLGTWEAITRKTAEKDGVQYVGPNTASAISDVATARVEKAEAELKAANERAEKAEAELADALRCSGENAKAWQEAVCDEAVKRTHLLKEIGLTEQQRDALAARAAELEGALETIDKELCVISEGKQEEIRNDISSGEAAGWTGAHDHVGPIILSALSRTTAQSLAACKAAALREVAKEMQEVTDSIVWCEAELQGRQAIIDRVSEMAERLEAEAAHGPQ